jgi:hypothetical protein
MTDANTKLDEKIIGWLEQMSDPEAAKALEAINRGTPPREAWLAFTEESGVR